ncbi:ACT domain-containing protein [Irpex rosettiformis]|uniref:ACT domain-containing protein n=1 Tax=Irpex rosettiformis TaxID=378272 RepID=A0ACB8UJB4_9APHY|nr:ACT domain-containing protein [Irpex rosettiformis]
MPPPYPHPSFQLILLPNSYNVTQFKPEEPIPQSYIDALTGARSKHLSSGEGKMRMLSITRTNEEVSIVEEVELGEGEWRCVRVMGPMAFDVVGVINNATAPIKAAGVGVFVVSTWNTDYILISREHIETAVEAWKGDGWEFVE